jgi:hypothetical protein
MQWHMYLTLMIMRLDFGINEPQEQYFKDTISKNPRQLAGINGNCP